MEQDRTAHFSTIVKCLLLQSIFYCYFPSIQFYSQQFSHYAFLGMVKPSVYHSTAIKYCSAVKEHVLRQFRGTPKRYATRYDIYEIAKDP